MVSEAPQALTISATMVYHAMEGVRRSGHDLDELLEASGIVPSLLQTPDARIPVEQVVNLFQRSIKALNDEFYGLLEYPIRPGFSKIRGLLSLQAGTLGRATQRIIEFHDQFDLGLKFSQRTIGSCVELSCTRVPGHEIADNYAIEASLASFHRFGGWLCNERIILDQVTFDFSPPPYRQEYEHMYFGAPILFERDSNTIRFDAGYLNHKIVQNEESVEKYARRIPLDTFLPLNAGGQLGQTVRKYIQDAFAQRDKTPTMDELAEQLQIQPHTLRRRLKEDGTSFHTIKSQVRRDIAIHHLGNRNTSVEKIAEYSGYAEAGAFIRAFKAWTGFTPMQFRKGLQFH